MFCDVTLYTSANIASVNEALNCLGVIRGGGRILLSCNVFISISNNRIMDIWVEILLPIPDNLLVEYLIIYLTYTDPNLYQKYLGWEGTPKDKTRKEWN